MTDSCTADQGPNFQVWANDRLATFIAANSSYVDSQQDMQRDTHQELVDMARTVYLKLQGDLRHLITVTPEITIKLK